MTHFHTFAAGLLLLLSVITLPGCKRPADISYTAMLAELKAGNVVHVEFSEGQAIVDFKKAPKGLSAGKLQCRVTLPSSDMAKDELVELLQEQRIPFKYSK